MDHHLRPGELPAALAAQLADLSRTLDALASTVETVRAANASLAPLADAADKLRRGVASAAGCLTASVEKVAQHPAAVVTLGPQLVAALDAVRADTEKVARVVGELVTLAELVPQGLDAADLDGFRREWRGVGVSVWEVLPLDAATRPLASTVAVRRVALHVRRVLASTPPPRPHAPTLRRYCRRTYCGAKRGDDPSPPTRPGALVGASVLGKVTRESEVTPT